MKDGVITGIHAGEDEIGMAVLEKGKMAVCRETEVPYHSHGTGDLFDAVLCGALLGGKTCISPLNGTPVCSRLSEREGKRSGGRAQRSTL